MKAKIIIVLFLLLVGLGDWAEHHMVCAAAAVQPVSCSDEKYGKRGKDKKELLPIPYTYEEIGKKDKSNLD
ncbi:hypothetical protein [uncultured Dialister sp.]|uniref:hypothetical protein n=1 Tax=uncultured Dialister sp. TaxID=278064 RepID=UPI0026371502|nr:hypothetical protein [uncultured Dialister sp.]